MDIAGFDIVEAVETGGATCYFARKDGKAVTREFATIDAVRDALECMEAKGSSAWLAEALPHGAASIVHPQSIFLYALGKLLLRLLTWGRYPRAGKPHNVNFVTTFPGYVLMAAFIAVTVIYS